MPRRPSGDSPDEQQIKYYAHKKANETLKHYLDTENYIGAYIIAFSLYEDRLRALCVLYFRDVEKTEWKERVNFPLTKIIKQLKKKALEEEIYRIAFEVNQKRNGLLHEAMYNIDYFTKEHVVEVMRVWKQLHSLTKTLRRQADSKNKVSNNAM